MTMKRIGILTSLLIFIFLGTAWAEDKTKITLEQAIATALQNFPDVQAASREIEAVKSREAFSEMYYYPEVHLLGEDLVGTNNSARSSYLSLPGIPTTGIQGMSNDTSNNFLGGIVLNQNLYDFGRRSGLIRASRARVRAEEANLLSVQQETELNVKQAYFALLAAQRLIQVNHANVERRTKIYEMVQEGYKLGLKPKIDVSTAKTQLNEAQIGLIRAEGELKNQKTSLDHSMGLENSIPYEIKDILDFVEISGSLETFLQESALNRPEIKDALERMKIVEHELQAVESNNYPFLNASASLNSRGTDVSSVTNWDLAAIIDVPIDWFRVRHQVDEATARVGKSRERLRSVRQRIELEVEEAFNDWNSAKESIPAARESRNEAQERLEIAEGRYKVGIGNIIELTDAQTFMTHAEAEYVRSLYDYHRAIARLERAVGRSLMMNPS